MKEATKSRFSFEPHSLIRDVLKNLWVVILSALIGFMAVSIWNQGMYTPQYTSTSTLIVNLNNSATYSYTTLSSSTEVAQIFTKVFTQPTMTGFAAENLGMKSFSGHVSSSVLQNTNIFTVSVTSSSPELSYKELCSILEVYPKISEAIFSDAVVEIMRHPNLPTSPSNSISQQNMLLAVAGCAILALGLIVLISLLRNTVKDEETFNREIESKLIGAVTHEKRRIPLKTRLSHRKISLLVDNAFASYSFTENYHKIATKLEYMHRNEGAKVFLITSYAENEGKSTTAANIALTLTRRANRVLLIDMDFYKPSLHKVFEIEAEEEKDVADLLSGKIQYEDFEFYHYKETSLDLGLNKKHHNDFVDWIHSNSMRSVMSELKNSGKYDYILVDTPPVSVAAEISTLLHFVDRSILVVRTDCVYIEDINDVIMSLKENGNNFSGCILNDVYKEMSFMGQLGLDESGYYGSYGYRSKYHKYGKYGSKYDKCQTFLVHHEVYHIFYI